MHRPIWLGNFQIGLCGECSSPLGTFCTVLFLDHFYPHFTPISGTPWVPGFSICAQRDQRVRKLVLLASRAPRVGPGHWPVCVCVWCVFRQSSQEAAPGASLVVQWLRLQAPDAGGQASIPGQGTGSHVHAAPKSSHVTLRASTTKLIHFEKKKPLRESSQNPPALVISVSPLLQNLPFLGIPFYLNLCDVFDTIVFGGKEP